ncbi:hypothetical protein KIPB_013781, partial [Kipferlia bialata]|eukprot:g13781.t1
MHILLSLSFVVLCLASGLTPVPHNASVSEGANARVFINDPSAIDALNADPLVEWTAQASEVWEGVTVDEFRSRLLSHDLLTDSDLSSASTAPDVQVDPKDLPASFDSRK